MNNLEYKGYFGSIEKGKEDNRLYGTVLGMTKDCIAYEGNDIDELEKDFRDAIESYLEGCKELGIKPRKEINGTINISIPADIHSRMVIFTQNNGTSINDFIRKSIERQLETAS